MEELEEISHLDAAARVRRQVRRAVRILGDDPPRARRARIVDAGRRVLGVVTDGDIRHAIVHGVPMHARVTQAMTTDFVRGAPGESRDSLRARLPGRTRVMPIVDGDGRLVDVANLWTVGDQAH